MVEVGVVEDVIVVRGYCLGFSVFLLGNKILVDKFYRSLGFVFGGFFFIFLGGDMSIILILWMISYVICNIIG